MNTLLVGDPHLKISILEDARRFIAELLGLIRTRSYRRVILLGDQFDSFAIVRSEILSLWNEFFREASKHSRLIALVGNHDLAGSQGGTHPMEPFKAFPNVTVVDQIELVDNIFLFPFIRSTNEFERLCRELPPKSVLICHQSFNGCQFENGFYDPNGADPRCVGHLNSVISGHIHKAQRIANIWYPGTPFQQTFSDAGEQKKVYEIDLSESGYSVIQEIALDMPRFVQLQARDVESLKTEIAKWQFKSEDLSKINFKLCAQGTPGEITNFWQQPDMQQFRRSARRVVDALTSVKPEQSLPGIQGKTQKEKLNEYIRSKKWRTDPTRLGDEAEKLLVG